MKNDKFKDLKDLKKLFETKLSESDINEDFTKDEISDFTHDLAFDVTPNKNLEIRFVDKSDWETFKQVFSSLEWPDLDSHMYDLFDNLMGNGLEWVDPEDIGALTDAPIIAYDGNIYWYPDAAIRSPLTDLANNGKVIFRFGHEDYRVREGKTWKDSKGKKSKKDDWKKERKNKEKSREDVMESFTKYIPKKK